MIVPFSIKVDSRTSRLESEMERRNGPSGSPPKMGTSNEMSHKKQPRLLTEQPTSLLEEKIEKRRRARKHQKHI